MPSGNTMTVLAGGQARPDGANGVGPADRVGAVDEDACRRHARRAPTSGHPARSARLTMCPPKARSRSRMSAVERWLATTRWPWAPARGQRSPRVVARTPNDAEQRARPTPGPSGPGLRSRSPGRREPLVRQQRRQHRGSSARRTPRCARRSPRARAARSPQPPHGVRRPLEPAPRESTDARHVGRGRCGVAVVEVALEPRRARDARRPRPRTARLTSRFLRHERSSRL